MLYALRYETHSNNDISGLVDALRKRGVPDKYCQAVHSMLGFGGTKQRGSELFGSSNPMDFTKKFIKGLKVRSIEIRTLSRVSSCCIFCAL